MAKDINFSKNVGYSEESDEYVVVMEQRKFRWWWLLLLLPLLLLIKCNKTIEVRCYDSETNTTIVGQDVTFLYDTIVRVEPTNAQGVAVFDSLRTSVFGYVFLFWKQCRFVAVSDCYASDTAVVNFHYTRHVDLPMNPRRADLYVKLLDKETGDLLPGGIVNYKYTENGEQKTGKAQADANSVVEIKNMRLCSKIDLVAQCDGYEDAERLQTPCGDVLVPDDANAMRLKPIKDKFTFYVKNKETKQPIADAQCTVVLTNPNGTERERRQVPTSSDGQGIAVFSNAFIRATVAIDVVKHNFKPGKLDGGPFTVEEFKNQPEEVRTIWLEPEPFVVEFTVVECSSSSTKVVGAKVKIKIIDTNGNVVEEVEETTNSNGVFPVKTKEGYKVIIDISCPPLYEPKHYEIDQFGEDIDKTICLEPDMVELVFRTVDGNNNLVPDCKLEVRSSKRGLIVPPNNSGNGSFKIKMRKDELISITASKKDCVTNSTKVNTADYNYLMSSQSNRDIPMLWFFDLQIPYTGVSQLYWECYDLPVAPGSKFTFEWSGLSSECTQIYIEDANGKRLGTYGYQTNNNKKNGSVKLTATTSRICVYVIDGNGHACKYHIEP